MFLSFSRRKNYPRHTEYLNKIKNRDFVTVYACCVSSLLRWKVSKLNILESNILNPKYF